MEWVPAPTPINENRRSQAVEKTGIIGKTSTIGLNTMYASGNRANNKLSIK